jgi:hypothetical protein
MYSKILFGLVCQNVFGTDCTFEEAVYKNKNILTIYVVNIVFTHFKEWWIATKSSLLGNTGPERCIRACMPKNSNFPVWRYRAEHFFRKSKYKSGDLNEFSKTHFPS